MDDKNKKDNGGYYAATTAFKNIKSYTEMYDAQSTDDAINSALNNYYTTNEIDEMFGDYYTKSEIDETLGDYYTKGEIDDNFYTKDEVDAKVASVYHFKGSVDTYVELKELTGMEVGDVYNVVDTGKNYAWTGVTSAYDEGWDTLGGTFDLNNYYTKNEADALLSAKVDNEDLDAYYTKTEADALLSAKVDNEDLDAYYTKTDADALLSAKVDAVAGMGLSHNDFTDTYKTKLDGIASGAQANVIETVKVNNTTLTPDANKAINISKADGSTFGVVKLTQSVHANIAEVDTDAAMSEMVGYQIGQAVNTKANKSSFATLSSLNLVDTEYFDVEELATKYNTLVTVLSGIAVALNA